MGIETIYSGVCTDEVNGVVPPLPIYCDCNLGSAPVCGADLDISYCTKPGKKERRRKKGLVGEEITDMVIQQAVSPPPKCLSRAALILFEYNATYIARVSFINDVSDGISITAHFSWSCSLHRVVILLKQSDAH